MNIDVLAQLVLSGITSGVMAGTVGVGLVLILGVTGRFHFAYGLTFTLAGYVAAVLVRNAGVSPWVSLLAGVVVAAVVGLGMELFIYRPLDRGGRSALLPVFVSSLGLTIVGTNLIILAWAQSTPSINYPLVPLRTFHFGSVYITQLDLIITITLLVLVLALSLIRSLTPWGRAVRAVQSNVIMAQAVGIRPRFVTGAVFAVGSAISGLTGAFTTAQLAANPSIGNTPIFTAFIVAFIAGTSAPPWRVLLAGIGLGLLQSLSTEVIPVQYSSLVVFVVLFVFLILKAASTLTIFRRRTASAALVEPAAEA